MNCLDCAPIGISISYLLAPFLFSWAVQRLTKPQNGCPGLGGTKKSTTAYLSCDLGELNCLDCKLWIPFLSRCVCVCCMYLFVCVCAGAG